MPTARIFAILVLTASCAPIPDLEFTDAGEAGVSTVVGPLQESGAPIVIADSGAPAPPVIAEDAAPPVSDASEPPGPAEAGPPPACALPPGALLCCGSVPCVGNKCAQHCDLCAPCQSGKVCCLAPNGKTAACGADVASCGHGAGSGGQD